MWEKRKKTAWMGGVGVVAILGGVLGVYPVQIALFAGLAIWIIGATVVNLLAR